MDKHVLGELLFLEYFFCFGEKGHEFVFFGILSTCRIHTNRVLNNNIGKPAFEYEYNLRLTVILYITGSFQLFITVHYVFASIDPFFKTPVSIVLFHCRGSTVRQSKLLRHKIPIAFVDF